MRTSKTIEVSPLGITIEVDVDVDWEPDTFDGQPSEDVQGWEYDEAAAVADFWELVDDGGEDVTRTIIAQLAEKKLSVREAIAAEVSKAVETMDLEDDGEDLDV